MIREQRRLEQAVTTALTVVDAIEAADFERPTACGDWNVGDVLNAMAVKAGIFAHAAATPMPEKPDPWPQLIGVDHKADIRRAAENLVATYGGGAVASEVVLPMGTVPAALARGAATLDLVLHAWDLTDALGRPFPADPDLIRYCIDMATVILTDELRRRGEFGPAGPVGPDQTDLERLLALTGRRSRTGPPPG